MMIMMGDSNYCTRSFHHLQDHSYSFVFVQVVWQGDSIIYTPPLKPIISFTSKAELSLFNTL